MARMWTDRTLKKARRRGERGRGERRVTREGGGKPDRREVTLD